MNTDLPTRKCRNQAQASRQGADPNGPLVPMNEYHAIENVVERLEQDYDWTHSFIRECYFTTTHNLNEFSEDSGETRLGDTAGPQDVRLIVACAGSDNDTGIEFIFRDVSTFSIQTLDELSFEHSYDRHSGHFVSFSGTESDRECFVNATIVFARFLGRGYLGVELLLGFELPTSEAHVAQRLDNCWRLCGNCSNAWEDSPKVEFCRCPDCGAVTRLAAPVP